MGYDFYTVYKLCIEYKRDNDMVIFTQKVDDTRKRQYRCEMALKEDSEEWCDYNKRVEEAYKKQIQYIYERDYPREDLCWNGLWKCIPSEKDKCLEIAAEEKIPAESIVNVWKEGDNWEY